MSIRCEAPMDPECRRVLLELARESIRAQLSGEPLPPLPSRDAGVDAGGAFVTLRNHGRLRGCIGQFHMEGSLANTIQQVSISVLSDPRFTRVPVTAEELPSISVEISVLSPMKRTNDPYSIQAGIHGVFIRARGRSGCFLPQVAPEMGWNRDQFLSRCCSDKAGLPADAWRDPQTEIYVFTSEHFGEADS